MKINQSELRPNSLSRSSNQPRNNCLILFIFFLLFTLGLAYFLWRERQLFSAQQLVQDCVQNNHCSGISSALEKLVKAQKSLQLLNLEGANLENANFSHADLYRTNLAHTNLKDALS